MEQDLEAVELNSIEHASLQSILQILKDIREIKKGIDLNFKKPTKSFWFTDWIYAKINIKHKF